MGRPLWVDDPRFNLDYHVRHTALPEPGQRGAAAPADRPDLLPAARPLEAAVGAVAGAGSRGRPLRAHQQDPPLARRRRLRRRPHDRPVRHRRRRRRRSRPRAGRRSVEPSRRDAGRRGREGHRGAARRGSPAGRSTRRGGRARPRPSVREAAEGLGGIAWKLDRTRRPTTPLNVPIGPHRRVLWLRFPLADLKKIKNALGGTVNDVFLAVVVGRARPLAAPPRRAHRGPGAARHRAGLDPRRTSRRARSATGSRRCSGRCRSTRRTRVERLRIVSRGDEAA